MLYQYTCMHTPYIIIYIRNTQSKDKALSLINSILNDLNKLKSPNEFINNNNNNEFETKLDIDQENISENVGKKSKKKNKKQSKKDKKKLKQEKYNKKQKMKEEKRKQQQINQEKNRLKKNIKYKKDMKLPTLINGTKCMQNIIYVYMRYCIWGMVYSVWYTVYGKVFFCCANMD